MAARRTGACFETARMTPAQKLQMVADLYHAGIRLRVAGLRREHPDWPLERLEFEARRSLLHAGT